MHPSGGSGADLGGETRPAVAAAAASSGSSAVLASCDNKKYVAKSNQKQHMHGLESDIHGSHLHG